MLKNMLAATLLGVLAIGGTVAAGPGPNGNNEGGLCTAYFNGQKNGHDNDNAGGNGNGNGRQPGEAPGPFQGLEQTAGDAYPQDGENDGDEFDAAESVFEFCQEYGIGGNPEHGRYACEMVQDDAEDAEEGDLEAECSDNEEPGNSGNGNSGNNGNGKGRNG